MRHFINTSSGKKFFFDPVDPDTISIGDIAHALSNICRFNGHTDKFFSVAQHSMLVCIYMPGTPEEKLAALLHDAAEAYVCDIPTPLKTLLGPSYKDIQDGVQEAISRRYGVVGVPNSLHDYDYAACVIEAQAFFGYSKEELQERGFNTGCIGLWEPWDPKAMRACVGDVPHDVIEREFILMFRELMSQCRRYE